MKPPTKSTPGLQDPLTQSTLFPQSHDAAPLRIIGTTILRAPLRSWPSSCEIRTRRWFFLMETATSSRFLYLSKTSNGTITYFV